jgi:hypothetical protein
MLHAGLDLSRKRLDVCLVDERGELIAETAAPPDADGLRGLAERVRGQRVRAVIESMNGARFVHDTLAEHGWEVLVADAKKVKGLAPLACKTDRIDARVLAPHRRVGQPDGRHQIAPRQIAACSRSIRASVVAESMPDPTPAASPNTSSMLASAPTACIAASPSAATRSRAVPASHTNCAASPRLGVAARRTS